MTAKQFALLLFATFTASFLGSYSSSHKQSIPEQKTETNKSIQLNNEALFQKKQECQKYRQEIEKRLNERGNTLSDGTRLYFVLNKIFYSPKANSCLYIATMEGGSDEAWFLEDALSGEGLLYRRCPIGAQDFAQQKKSFYDMVRDYE